MFPISPQLGKIDQPEDEDRGVAVYIGESLLFKNRPDYYNSAYECLWITLRPKWLPRKFQNLQLRVYIYHRR